MRNQAEASFLLNGGLASIMETPRSWRGASEHPQRAQQGCWRVCQSLCCTRRFGLSRRVLVRAALSLAVVRVPALPWRSVSCQEPALGLRGAPGGGTAMSAANYLNGMRRLGGSQWRREDDSSAVPGWGRVPVPSRRTRHKVFSLLPWA